MTRTQRSGPPTRFTSGRRPTRVALFLFTCLAGTTSIAATSCGAEEPADRPPADRSRYSLQGIDVGVSCAGSPACCAAQGARCGGTVECCTGTRCIAMADGYFRCAVPCARAGDCPSGCCAAASPDGERVCTAEPCCDAGATACTT